MQVLKSYPINLFKPTVIKVKKPFRVLEPYHIFGKNYLAVKEAEARNSKTEQLIITAIELGEASSPLSGKKEYAGSLLNRQDRAFAIFVEPFNKKALETLGPNDERDPTIEDVQNSSSNSDRDKVD